AVALDDRHRLVAGLGKAPEPLLAGLKSLLVASSLRRVPVGVADPLGGAAMIFPHATTSLLLLLLHHRVFRPLQALGSPESDRAARRQLKVLRILGGGVFVALCHRQPAAEVIVSGSVRRLLLHRRLELG